MALIAQRPENLGPGRVGEAVGIPKGATVLPDRLLVGAELGRARRCDRCVDEHGVRVAGFFGVVSQPGGVGATGLQGSEQSPVQVDPAPDRDLTDHGQPCQLVAEGQGAVDLSQQPAVEGLVDRGEPLRQQVHQESGLRPGSGEGDDLERELSGLVEPGNPCQHRVADGRGQQRRAGREHLGHEECVAPGDVVQLRGVLDRCLRVLAGVQRDQGRDAGRRQRGQVDAASAAG